MFGKREEPVIDLEHIRSDMHHTIMLGVFLRIRFHLRLPRVSLQFVISSWTHQRDDLLPNWASPIRLELLKPLMLMRWLTRLIILANSSHPNFSPRFYVLGPGPIASQRGVVKPTNLKYFFRWRQTWQYLKPMCYGSDTCIWNSPMNCNPQASANELFDGDLMNNVVLTANSLISMKAGTFSVLSVKWMDTSHYGRV